MGSLEAERERLESENEKMSNRMARVIAIVSEIASRNSDMEKSLPDLKNELDAEQIEMFDRGLKYLMRWRLQLAARRLETTDQNVLQVALDVGYESEAAFSRAFKREIGVPPARYRREYRERT